MIKLPKDELDFLKKGGEELNESKKEGIHCIYSFHIASILN